MVEWPFVAAVERHNNNSEVVIHAAVRRTYETKRRRFMMELYFAIGDRHAMAYNDKYIFSQD